LFQAIQEHKMDCNPDLWLQHTGTRLLISTRTNTRKLIEMHSSFENLSERRIKKQGPMLKRLAQEHQSRWQRNTGSIWTKQNLITLSNFERLTMPNVIRVHPNFWV
jgi:hypothetical protein